MKHTLRLYITGRTPNSVAAVRNLQHICAKGVDGSEFEVDVIDVLENPDLAEEEKILATPTLVKALPMPLRKIIGDLSDHQKVLVALDLIPPLGVSPKTA